jgi:hypothetical protein
MVEEVKDFHNKSPEDTIKALESNQNGLTHDQATSRKSKYGDNENIREKKQYLQY